ncbi:MAG TPA: hypothetical protein PKD17_02110 [Cellvibrionaceae bacterium]|nr:hypothetical protein [Cellvibrionaceae bacterium]HMW70582.1 hypothetical protein [Cellvibrionaceae bacterium]HMY38476.1 hypothetical protein [Marinagarivorans sp.]HNG58510.1 hypothetical protein [Cellvibrionaceae bacterium]
MSRIEAFLPTQTLLTLVAELAEKEGANIIFCRYKPTDQKPGFTVVQAAPDLANKYLDGKYEQILLSLKGLPKHEQDWEFIERASAYLIEINGGRQDADNIGQTTIRLIDKKSKATKVFNGLKAAVKAISGVGVLVNGNPYPKIYYAQSLIASCPNLWVDIETKQLAVKLPG